MIFPLQQQWLQEVKITGKNARTESCTCMIKILKLDDEGKKCQKKTNDDRMPKKAVVLNNNTKYP